MREFGKKIPWLRGLENLQFITNGKLFEDQLLAQLRQTKGCITPYQFVDKGPTGLYVGGFLLFAKSPEILHDPQNIRLAERLVSEGSQFISCLQIHETRRGSGVGRRMMSRAIRAIQLKHDTGVWGVVSDSRLLAWYASIGAITPNSSDNNDDLWIVHWPKPSSPS